MYRLNLHRSLPASIRPVTGDLTADRHSTRLHSTRAYEELMKIEEIIFKFELSEIFVFSDMLIENLVCL